MNNKKLNICIVGCGNISNTRHIPVLKQMKNNNIIGIISSNEDKLNKTSEKWNINNKLVVNNPKNEKSKIEKTSWFKEVDAVIIGTPPQQHYELSKVFLELGKHVLVEKPMMMNEKESQEIIELAKKKNLIFNVVHNFQYASQMLKLNKIIEEKTYGDIISITEVQFTNRYRRLPSWYNDLPLGLFYDEAAHFIYLLQKHLGKVKIDDVYKYDYKKEETPLSLTINATANKVPVTMLLNFNAPVCQWLYIVNFNKKIFIYDFFKDILIGISTDNEHLAKDVLKNDLSMTFQYWWGFIKNGFKRVFKKLWYGHDIVIKNFINACNTKEADQNISCEHGKDTVITMNEIVKKGKAK